MEILEQTAIVAQPEWYIHLTVLVGLVLLGGGATLISFLAANNKLNKLTLTLSVVANAVLPAIVIFIMVALGPTIESGKNMYKAKIDDNYTANKLYENYTDIKYIGDGIYTFEDRVKE